MGAGEADFEEWFRKLLPDAAALARRLLGSQHEAEEAAAEAFARALARWSRIGRLRYRDAWLMRTTTNVAIDTIRRRRDQPATYEVHADPADATALRVALAAALERLPKRQRQVVVLHYLADWPKDRVAESLGVSPNTVKKHDARAMAALRSAIGPAREAFDAF